MDFVEAKTSTVVLRCKTSGFDRHGNRSLANLTIP